MARARGPLRSPRGSLRRRFAMALVLLTAAAAAVQGLGYLIADRWVATRSIQALLDNELNHLLRSQAAPADEVPEPELSDAAVRYYRSDRGRPPPAALQVLAPGWYPRVPLSGGDYQVLVRNLGEGQRAWLLHEAATQEGRDHVLVWLFSFGALLISALMLWLSGGFAARALVPLDALVAKIRALDPNTPGARLKLEETGELGVIAEAVNGLLDELDRLIERERAFAAAASHELRTPLAVIGGAADVLATLPQPVPAAPLARITRAVDQARLDLDALLRLSRDRAAPPAVRFAPARLLQWAEPYLAQVPNAARLEWRLTAAPIEIAEDSLRIVFTNLLRNALRAVGAAGTVYVELEPGALRVIDDGPGIATEDLPRVFEPHFSGAHGGTGIGLYIARTLAQRHGWTLTLANREAARGAVATLRF